jgi:hypothetical protein
MLLGCLWLAACVGTESGNPRPPFDDDGAVDLTDPTAVDFTMDDTLTDAVTDQAGIDDSSTPDEASGGTEDSAMSGGVVTADDATAPAAGGGTGGAPAGGAEPAGGASAGGSPSGGSPEAVPGAGAMTASTAGVNGLDADTGDAAASDAMCEEPSCAAEAEQAADTLRQMAIVPGALQMSECVALVDPTTGADAGMGCECQLDDGTSFDLNGTNGCRLAGRVGCLMSEDEFPGCDEGLPAATCDAACEQALQARTADAAARTVSVVSSVCQDSACQYILDVDGECFQNGSVEAVPCP